MKHLLLLFTLVFLLISCKKGSIQNAEGAFDSYLSQSDSVVFAGSADFKSVIGKANFSSQPKLNAIVSEVVGKIQSAFDLDSRIFFTVKGPVSGSSEMVFFIDVKSEKDFTSYLKKSGYEVKKEGGFNYAIDDMAFVYYTSKYAVMKYAETDKEYTLADVTAFKEKLNDGKKKESKLSVLSKGKGDVIFSSDMYQLMLTNNTDLSRLPKDQQDKIYNLYKEMYIKSVASFENGYFDLTSTYELNDELKKAVQFSPNGPIDLSKLGNETPVVGLALNLNLKEMSAFWNKYFPGYMEDFFRNTNEVLYNAYKLSDGDFSKFSDGKLALTISGKMADIEMGMTPSFNLYGGLGSLSENFKGLLQDYLLKKDFKVFVSNDKTFRASTNESAFTGKEVNRVPSFAKGFGKESISFYVNVKEIFQGESEGPLKSLSEINYLTAYGNSNMFNLRIQLVDTKKNFLEQALSIGMVTAEGYFGGLGSSDDY